MTFRQIISSVCYVVPSQTLWVSASSPVPIIYDPRSGINVSDFVKTDDERLHKEGAGFGFRSLLFIPENNEVIGISTRRSLYFWKYNQAAPLTVLPGHADIAECLTFNSKEPLLIFSGGDDGNIRKWERLQLNTFMYSFENLSLPKEEFHEIDKSMNSSSFETNFSLRRKGYSIDRQSNGKHPKDLKMNRPGVNVLFYYEEMDYLISGYEDSRICIWGYNEETIQFIPQDTVDTSQDAHGSQGEGVNNRVAGMSLKVTLLEHKEAVTGIICLMNHSKHWMITTGWDRRLCIWDLSTLKLHDIFRNSSAVGKEELAADGIILSIDYSPELNQFGYTSSDKVCLFY